MKTKSSNTLKPAMANSSKISIQTKRKKGPSAAAFPLQKIVTIYKVDQKVTVRKPGGKEPYIQFTVEPTSNTTLAKMKQFVKYIINDIKELNFLKNDMGFLMSEIYGKEHSTDLTVEVDEGKIFYFWVYLPLVKDRDDKKVETSVPIVQREVFPFDIFYIRQRLTDTDCKSIQNLLKRDVDAQIHVRDVHQIPKLPFPIKVTLLP